MQETLAGFTAALASTGRYFHQGIWLVQLSVDCISFS